MAEVDTEDAMSVARKTFYVTMVGAVLFIATVFLFIL
jgi:hypothetical protein